MKDFFNFKKTGNIALWTGGVLGLSIGLFAIIEGTMGAGLFWLGLSGICFYALWRRKK